MNSYVCFLIIIYLYVFINYVSMYMCSSMLLFGNIYLLSWMMHGKGKTLFCAKIGIVMPLLIFKIQCTNSGGVFYFDGLSSFYF